MDAISNITVAVGPKPQAPAIKIGGSGGTALPLPKSVDMPLPQPQQSTADISAKMADQRRYEQLQRAANAVANLYAISDRTFTIYKDTGGTYITRYVSLRDGKVTYIPEPDLIEMTRRRQLSEAQTNIIA